MSCYRSRLSLVFNLLLRHDISQGSVARQIRCGGIFSDDIIANLFFLILTVKQIRKSVNNRYIYELYKKFVQFLGHSVHVPPSLVARVVYSDPSVCLSVCLSLALVAR